MKLKGIFKTRRIFINGKEITPEYSQKIRNHSPDGFMWGYGGSGPAQLALAILLEVSDDIDIASSNYQQFKWDIIANLPSKDFEVEINISPYWKEAIKNKTLGGVKKEKINTSEMAIGDYGLYAGDIVCLRDGGLSGGCETDKYLAYVCTIGDEYDGHQDNPASDTLSEIFIDDDTTA